MCTARNTVFDWPTGSTQGMMGLTDMKGLSASLALYQTEKRQLVTFDRLEPVIFATFA